MRPVQWGQTRASTGGAVGGDPGAISMAWYDAAMQVTIDAAGRVVVPKTLRDELNLHGGTLLEVRVHEGRLELEPVAARMRLVRRGRGQVAIADEPLPRIGADQVRAIVESQRR